MNKTPYAVKCHGDSVPEAGSCGIVYLEREGQHGYLWQMNKLNSKWYCPNCGSNATFQDDIYEEAMEESERKMMEERELCPVRNVCGHARDGCQPGLLCDAGLELNS